ncbi:hypothetical protein EAG_14591 [Camponotus floridanus]|uniref:Uncharacterized protein n=1 Tax=Camponotus floridanus TaxID=104421 RepID=E2A611_CAMFO|nr:hypothetical protein EAG_14591 [Camponotus floridanus]
MPATKNLTQSCRKQLSPHDDWNEFKFHKHFGPYDTYSSARSVEQAVAQMSTSDDNIVLQEETKNIAKKRLIKARKLYGDTSNEDEPKKKKIIKFPSNYIPESGKSVSQLSSQPINESSTITNLACGSIKANDEALTNVPTKSVNDINEPEISDEILETNFADSRFDAKYPKSKYPKGYPYPEDWKYHSFDYPQPEVRYFSPLARCESRVSEDNAGRVLRYTYNREDSGREYPFRRRIFCGVDLICLKREMS